MKTKNLLVEHLEESELRYRRLFESAQDGILILDAKTGGIMDVNPYLVEMLGYSREEFIGKKLWEVGAFKDIKASKDAFKILQKKKYIRYKDLPLVAKTGRIFPVEFVSNVYKAGSEKVIQCNIRDISERKQVLEELKRSESMLRELSVRDPLTGLFNLRYMEETLEREISRESRAKRPLGIIMLDLDNLKYFNDLYGHAAGDAILRELGKLLIKQVRSEDFSSRVGGDEFVIVLPDSTRKITQKRAELFCDRVRAFQIQFESQVLEGITVSGGVAVYPEDGRDSREILKAADQALYRAKHEGRDRIITANS
jgi:diguanylate cyclase (GGDEF)-like protein/PAS domain S-box-containing protein